MGLSPIRALPLGREATALASLRFGAYAMDLPPPVGWRNGRHGNVVPTRCRGLRSPPLAKTDF